MTYEEICRMFCESGIDDYKYDARVLLEELFGECSNEKNYDSPELSDAVARRCRHIPLQYILGRWWFCDCEFFVDENCLIPRSDTEILVERAVGLLPKGGRFADLCAGSGCIGVTVLYMREDSVCDAVEKFPATLEIAKKNAEHNRVGDRYNPICADVFSGDCLDGQYDLILSNPPYIRADVIDTLSDEVKCEPRAALDGGEDGLDFYRAILDLYEKNLAEGGRFVFEIGYDQGKDIAFLCSERGMSCEIFRDYSGNDRAVVISPRSRIKC